MTQYARSQQGTLLDYRYKTVPATVNVSVGDDVQPLRLEVTVSGRADAHAQCEWVRITLPYGAKAEDLTLTDPKDLWTSAEGGDTPRTAAAGKATRRPWRTDRSSFLSRPVASLRCATAPSA